MIIVSLSRILSVDDGVIPSANAFLANVLSDLGHLLDRKDYLDKVIIIVKTDIAYNWAIAPKKRAQKLKNI